MEAMRMTTKKRQPLWRKPWLWVVAIFCGFMFGAVGTAAVPSSAQWTSGIVCSAPYHLIHQSSDTSYGNTSQESVGFSCGDGAGQSHAANTIEIFGLPFLLGTLVCLGLAFGVTAVVRAPRVLNPAEG
jgi:hypothetical protein